MQSTTPPALCQQWSGNDVQDVLNQVPEDGSPNPIPFFVLSAGAVKREPDTDRCVVMLETFDGPVRFSFIVIIEHGERYMTRMQAIGVEQQSSERK